jgi:hypothetical protein
MRPLWVWVCSGVGFLVSDASQKRLLWRRFAEALLTEDLWNLNDLNDHSVFLFDSRQVVFYSNIHLSKFVFPPGPRCQGR